MKISIILITLLLSLSSFAGTIVVDVLGMTCGMCQEAITKEVMATGKAEKVDVNLEKKTATVVEKKGQSLSDQEVKAAIKKAGYEGLKVSRSK